MQKNIYLLLLTILFQPSIYSQNKLDKSKKELNSNEFQQFDSTHINYSSTNKNRANKSSSFSESIGVILVDLVVYATYGVVKYGVIGNGKFESHLNNNLTPYPFYNHQSGNFKGTDTLNGLTKDFRIDVENHFIFSNNNLFGNHLLAKIRPSRYIYFQPDYYQLFETNKFENTNNQLSLFYFNLGYDRIRFERFNFGCTLGASYVGNEVNKAGFSFGLNTEYFLKNNISFSGEARWSSINGCPVNSYKVQYKFFKRNYFLGVNLEQLQIATPHYNLVGIGGGVYL